MTDQEYIDLGLPSGTLWATCNVGATNPTDYGDYFAWGETEPKDEYTYEHYNFCEKTYNALTKYCSNSDYGTFDGCTTLSSEDDPATVNWGHDWQTPTISQCQELMDCCELVWIESYKDSGVSGLLCTSKENGNSIFFPAGGHILGTKTYYDKHRCYYWTSNLNESNPSQSFELYYNHESTDCRSCRRCNGQNIRPVRK